MSIEQPDLYVEDLDSGKSEIQSLRDERDFWKQMFSTLVDEFPESVVVVNKEGRITHWNDEMVDLIGVSHSEAIGEYASDVIGVESETEILADTVARTGQAVREDRVRSGSTGDDEWHVRAAAAPLRTPEKDTIGAFEYVSDVTDLVEQRTELEEVQESITELIDDAVEELLAAAETNAETTTELDELTDQQATNLDEVQDEMSSLSATIEEIAASASDVSGRSETTFELADESKLATEEIVEMIDEVRDTTNVLLHTANDLESKMQEINSVVDVIDEIADQTNILALNANIQAAQVNSNTDGFSVVSNEIKSLANKSKDEVESIEAIVAAIHDDTRENIKNIQQTIELFDEITDSLELIDGRMSEIKDAADDANAGINQIANATDDQAASTEEVASMVDESVVQVRDVVSKVESLSKTNEKQSKKVRSVRDDVRDMSMDLDTK